MIRQKAYADRDIYNENGVLLVAKDEFLTDEIQKKLELIGTFSPYSNNNLQLETARTDPKELLNQTCDDLQKKVNVDCVELLSKASELLTIVLFDSKNKPWWAAVYAIENYVDWLYTHCIDVALLSTMVGIQLKFTETQLNQLALGSFLHDVGKLLIPKNIIQKPKKLTAAEYSIMEQHCILGIEMLQESGIPQMCINIILQHHERLDGRGYPYGLEGDQISYEAQIVMIADVLDAMTSYRPYKKEKSLKTAFAELRKKENLFNLDLLKQYASILIPRRSCGAQET